MKKVIKKVVAPKSKAKIAKKPLRKYEDGGMAGKGPLQPTPKKEKTAEELAKETVARLTTIPKVETPTPKATTPTKKRSDGFASDAQKTAYIKNAKSMLASGKSIDDLVKSKFGTKAGLAALGFKDEVKKAAPVKTTSNSKKEATTASTPSAPTKSVKPATSDPKKEGQKLKAEGMRQKGIGMAIKGKGLRNKAIANTLYRLPTAKEDDSRLITKALMPLKLMAEGKSQIKYVEHIRKSGLTKTEKEALAKNKKSQAAKQAKRTAEFTKTGKYSMYKNGGKTTTKKK